MQTTKWAVFILRFTDPLFLTLALSPHYGEACVNKTCSCPIQYSVWLEEKLSVAIVLRQIPRWPSHVACLNLLPLMDDEARAKEELLGLVLRLQQ